MGNAATRRTPRLAAAVILATAAWAALGAWAVSAPPEAANDGLIASPEPGWPQWRGPRRDGISDEKGLLPEWPEDGPRLLWKVEGLGTGWSSPIVVEDRLYITGDVGDDLVIFAFDRDGRPLWRAVNGASWKGPYPGARASCAFSEGKLYHLGAHGRLACLDASTGEELWTVNALDRFEAKNIHWALSECLLVDGNHVIVTPGGRKALMAALDKRDGRTVWTTEPLGDDRATYSSPILFRHLGRRLIANCSEGHGFGADADTGELLWTVPLRNRFGTNVATPIYGAGAIYYVTPYGEHGRQYRLRARGDGVVAEHAWTCDLETVTGAAVLLGDRLYAAGYRKPKWWLAVDWNSGEVRAELEELSTGAAIHADGRLYILDETGTVGLVDPGGGDMKLLGSFRLFERRERDAWAHPVLCDGRLYLRYHDALWCYDVRVP
jgi:outer membrane protein assembly factor BamB